MEQQKELIEKFVGKYRCASMHNVVPYCQQLGVSRFLLKLVPLAPLPSMSLTYDPPSEQFTFTASFKVGPFGFDDTHVFKTDGETVSYMKIAPSTFGATTAQWKDNTLHMTVRSILDQSKVKTLPANQHIEIRRYFNEQNQLVGTHELIQADETGLTSLQQQIVYWDKI